jgi:hypothetical protein
VRRVPAPPPWATLFEVAGVGVGQPGSFGGALDPAPHVAQPAAIEREDFDIGRPVDQLPGEAIAGGAVFAAALAHPALVHRAVGAGDLLQHFVAEGAAVVGAKQRPSRRRREGDVEQRLVALALVDLGRLAPRPDRFADAANRAAFAFVEEATPEGDDPGRVAAQLLHVGEANSRRIGAELGFEQRRLGPGNGDERRFARFQSATQERHGAGQEALGILVDQRLVPEAGQIHDHRGATS